MGYVPPSFEEFQNPELLLARLRRQERTNGLMLGMGLAMLGLVLLVVLIR